MMLKPALRPPLRAPMRGATTLREGGGVPGFNTYSNSNPLYLAHRNSGLRTPEETVVGIQAVLAKGVKAVEFDVQALADGTRVAMHDTTVTRTTTSTGNVVDVANAAAWAALVIDAASQNIGGYGNALTPPLFSEILTATKGRCLIMPEAKVTGVKQTLVDDLVAAGIGRTQALVQSLSLTDLAPAITAGYPACYVTNASTDIAAAQSAGVTWVAVDKAAADAVVDAWVAAGFKVLMWTVDRRWERDYYLARGVVGFISDDAEYLAANAALATADTWDDGKWMAGEISFDGAITTITRGGILSGGKAGYAAQLAGGASVLMGWASPVPSARSFTRDYSLTFDNAANTGRWIGIWAADTSMSDRPYQDDGSAINNGYHFLCRKSGVLEIFTRTNGSAASIGSAAGAAIADGETVFCRIQVTATHVNFYRLASSGGAVVTTLSIANTAFNPTYLHRTASQIQGGMSDFAVAA